MRIYKISHNLSEIKEVTKEEFMEWTKGLGETALSLLEVNGYVETAFSTYYNFMPIPFKDKVVRLESITIDGVDTKDYPDFCDAYISGADWHDGTPLSEEEVEEFAQENTTLPNELIFDNQLYL